MSSCLSVRPWSCYVKCWNMAHHVIWQSDYFVVGVQHKYDIFFEINAYKEINQSVDSKQDGKSMGEQTDGRMQQWMFGHNENFHADFLKFCDIRLSCDASVMFTCSFHLFSFSISVTANRRRAVCDLTRTACNGDTFKALQSGMPMQA